MSKIFYKAAKIIPWRKTSLFNKWLWENWIVDSRMQKSEVGSLPHPVHKNQLKKNQRPNCNSHNCKNLRKKIGVNFCDLVFGNGFLYDTKSISNERKNNKLGIIKI